MVATKRGCGRFNGQGNAGVTHAERLGCNIWPCRPCVPECGGSAAGIVFHPLRIPGHTQGQTQGLLQQGPETGEWRSRDQPSGRKHLIVEAKSKGLDSSSGDLFWCILRPFGRWKPFGLQQTTRIISVLWIALLLDFIWCLCYLALCKKKGNLNITTKWNQHVCTHRCRIHKKRPDSFSVLVVGWGIVMAAPTRSNKNR